MNYQDTQASFTRSECIVPDYRSQCIETSVVTDKKAKSIMNPLKSLSLNRKKHQSKEIKVNPGYHSVNSLKYNIDQESENCSFPSPTSPMGNSWLEECKSSYEVDEIESQPNYEEIDLPSPDRIPWYNTRGELFTSTQEPILKLNPNEPQDDYMDMEPTYNEVSPFMQLPEPVNDRKAKPVKPDIIPPMRKTISHNTVHSHKYPILAPEYQDTVPKPPKRAKSIGNIVQKKPTPSPPLKVRGNRASGYDVVPIFCQKISNKTANFVKIVNIEIPTKIVPNNQEMSTDDVIPSFPAKPTTKSYSPIEVSPQETRKDFNQRPDSIQSRNQSQSFKYAPKPNIKPRRPEFRSSVNENHAPTGYLNNLKERTNSLQRPPAIAVKPRRPKESETEAPKELNEQKYTMGERNDSVIKDLGNHLKQLNVVESIHSNSHFTQLNLYQ